MLLSGAEHKGTGRWGNSCAGAYGSAGGVQSQVSVALQWAGDLLISTLLPLPASWKDRHGKQRWAGERQYLG